MALLILGGLAAAGLGWWIVRADAPPRARDGLVAALYLVASVAFFWQLWLLPDSSVPRGGGDLVSFLFPTYRFAAETLQRGSFPFWNPYLYAGAPFAADLQSGLYYPPNLLAFLLARPFTYSTLETLAALHYPLAALSAYVLARTLDLDRRGAFAAGLVFAFSGFCVAHLGHYNMLAAASWAPLALAGLIVALRRGQIAWAALAGGAFALVILPGHSQTALYTALAMAIVTAIALWRGGHQPAPSSAEHDREPSRNDLTLRGRPEPTPSTAGRQPSTVPAGARWRGRHFRARLLALPIVVGLGALAAAVQLLPAVELARLSIRSDITYAQAREFAATPLGLITFIVPHFFGDAPNNFWGVQWSLQESYGYLGISGLVLAGLAVALAGRDRRPLVLASLAAFWLLVALGETTPLHGWMYRLIPGFDKVRAPGRGLLFVDLAGALLVGLMIQRLGSAPRRPARLIARAWTRALLVALGVLALAIVPVFYWTALTSQDKDPTILARTLTAASSLNLTVVLLAATVLLLRRWLARPRPGLALLAIGLVWLDLAIANAGFNATTEDLLVGYRHEEAVAWLRQNVGDGRIDTRTGIADVWQPDLAALAHLDDVAGIFNPLTLRAFDRYWEALGSRGVPGYDLLAVRYVVARADAPLDAAKFRRVAETEDGLGIFENRGALPRAFVAPRREVADEATIGARLRDPTFDPRTVALLTGGAPTAGGGGGRVVEIERPTPNELIVRLADVQGGDLVLSEIDYPGWRASVDGVERPIARAYNLLRAIPLAANAREVHLTFRPTRWPLALGLSALGWLGIGLAALRLLRRKDHDTTEAIDR